MGPFDELELVIEQTAEVFHEVWTHSLTRRLLLTLNEPWTPDAQK